MKKRNRYYTLIALTIGDGNIHNPNYKKGGKRSYLDIAHHIKHQDYIEFKKSILDDININNKIGIKRSKNIPKLTKVYTKGYHILESIRKRFYKNGHRKFYKRWVKNITIEHLALFWMDDGSFCKSKTRHGNYYYLGDISTLSYDLKSVKNLQKCFLQYGIESRLYFSKRYSGKGAGYGIRFNKPNLEKMCKLFLPIISKIPSMHYKLGYLQSDLNK